MPALKPAKATRRISGKTYYLHTSCSSTSEAREKGKTLKAIGTITSYRTDRHRLYVIPSNREGFLHMDAIAYKVSYDNHRNAVTIYPFSRDFTKIKQNRENLVGQTVSFENDESQFFQKKREVVNTINLRNGGIKIYFSIPGVR